MGPAIHVGHDNIVMVMQSPLLKIKVHMVVDAGQKKKMQNFVVESNFLGLELITEMTLSSNSDDLWLCQLEYWFDCWSKITEVFADSNKKLAWIQKHCNSSLMKPVWEWRGKEAFRHLSYALSKRAPLVMHISRTEGSHLNQPFLNIDWNVQGK